MTPTQKHQKIIECAKLLYEREVFDSRTTDEYKNEKIDRVESVTVDIITPHEFGLTPSLLRRLCQYAVEIGSTNIIYKEWLDLI